MFGIWGKVLGALAIVVAGWIVYQLITDHFDEYARLQKAETKLQGQVTELKALNAQNQKTWEAERKQLKSAQDIANANRKAAENRLKEYRRIRDEALNAPASEDGPVSPVLCRTIGRLWPDSEGNPGSRCAREAGDPAR